MKKLARQLQKWIRKALASAFVLLGFSIQKTITKRVARDQFCDYCRCEDCTKGTPLLASFLCEDGSRICSVCYLSEPCFEILPTLKQKRGSVQFCVDFPRCSHKPKLSGTVLP